MKLLILFLMLFSFYAFAEKGIIIDASADTIPTAFAANDDGSEVLSCGRGYFSIKTDADIYWATSNPPIDGGDAYNGLLVSPLQVIYIRSATGSALTSGKVYITCEANQ